MLRYGQFCAFTNLHLGYIGLREAPDKRLVGFSGNEATIELLIRLARLPEHATQKTFIFAPFPAGTPVALDDVAVQTGTIDGNSAIFSNARIAPSARPTSA